MHFRDKVNDKAVKELPETSIVIKTQDKSSEGMKTIAKNAADLGSKLRELQDKAHSLSKEKATLNANFDKAKKELTEAKKKFNETQDAMDGLKMEAAQANFDNLSYQFRSVSKEAEKARKEIENLDTKANKSMNSSGGIGGGFKSITNALVTMQAAQMIGGAVQGSLNTKIGSALGSDSGTLASSMISSVLSGAITGSAFGPLGVLAGATVGGITGAISGSAQRYESQDSSFKSYVQDAVQEQLDAQSESLTSGSSIAAGRETDKISFATLFGSKETADSYLTNLVGMANSTPFLYDDLTSMSKTLATYGYSILYQMYQEALERKDAARPPAERVRTAPKSRVTSFEARSADGTGTFNWLERNHVTFADIEGNTMRWEELGVGLDDGSKKARLIRALKRGKAICSDRQQQMLELSMEGKRVTEIAKILNVDKSTVSRTLNRAHQRIRDLAQFEEQYYEPDCDSEDSSEMDFADPETAKKLLGCLTERQAVYMYLYYGEWLTMEDIGKLLSVDKSTICRTLERAAIRIQGCFPATAQCGVLDLGAIGDVLWTLYQQQEIKSLVPEYAQEAARRANTMQLQRCDAAGISPAVHDHYPEQSLWPSFEMEPCEENAAASLQYVPPLIQFPSKTRFYARLWRTPFHGLVGQSRLLSALLEESRQSQVKHRSAYIYTRLCSLVSGFCNKVSRKIVSKLYRLKSKIAS